MSRLFSTFRRNAFLIKMSIPIFLELLLQILVGNVDQLMLTGNQTAINAIIQANTVTNVVLIAFSVLSTASLILITQLKGAKDEKNAGKIYALSFYFNLLLGIILSLVLLFTAEPIFRLLDVDEAVMPEAITYMRLTGSFIFLQALITTFSAFFRSNRLMVQSTAVSAVMNVVNIIGNAVLLYVFHLGVTGVAIASTLSRFVALIITVVLYVRHIGVSLSPRRLFPFPRVIFKRLIFVGIPSAGENLSYNFSQVVILMIINSVGILSANIKGYAGNFAMIVYMFANGITQAMQVVEGNYIGAREYDKADRLVKDGLIMSETVSLAMSLLLCAFSYPLFFVLFGRSPAAAKLGLTIMAIDVILEIGRVCNITSVRALQTAGDIAFPVIASMISCWTLAVFGSYALGVWAGLGLIGCWIAMTLDECVRAVAFMIRWRRGRWRRKGLIREITPETSSISTFPKTAEKPNLP